MNRVLIFLAPCLLLFPDSLAAAGKYNYTLDIGDAAPTWKKLPGTDGKEHSLDDLKDKKAVVLIFTCNSCPFAVAYEDRIIDFVKRHGGPKGEVGVMAVNVNRVPEDSPEKMAERAKAKEFNFPYLFDESQQIARDYGAGRTPQFFLLDGDRKIAYMGAMDDNDIAKQVKVRYLEDALQAVLAGKQPEVTETPTTGCAIRYARQRRSKPAKKNDQ